MGDNKTISIMLFGLSGAGKTTLLGSLFDQMCYNSIHKENISYSFEMDAGTELPDVVKDLKRDFNNGNFFPGSTTRTSAKDEPRVSFRLRIKKEKEVYHWPIGLGDYAGGSIDVFDAARRIEVSQQTGVSKSEDDDLFEVRQKQLADANVIFVLVDAIALVVCCENYKSDVRRCAKEMHADSVNITLSDIIMKKTVNDSDVTILFLLTKTDASIFDEYGRYAEYKDNNFEKLREMVKKIYQKVFDEAYHQAKVRGWSVGIVPVCVCGAGNVTTNIKEKGDIVTNELKEGGKIEPKGIDTAFMYAIRRTFISYISVLERTLEEKGYQKAIDQAANFLKLDENDNIIWECNSKFKAWLQDKEKASGYKKIINNAKTGIEMKKFIQPQVDELKKMRDLIEEGYHFDDRNRGVYDSVEPKTGVKQVDRTRNVM